MLKIFMHISFFVFLQTKTNYVTTMKQTMTNDLKTVASCIFFIGGSILILVADRGYDILGWIGIAFGILGLAAWMLQKKGVGPLIQPEGTLPTPQSERNGGEAIIRVRGVDKEQMNRAIEDFIKLYSDTGNPPSRPLIQASADGLLLSFPMVNGVADTDFEMFCFWVNYITLESDGKKNDVIGWYKMGDVKPPKTNQAIGQRTLCLFVPEDDTEGDNIYFVTEDGTCCKHSFHGLSSLRLINPSPRAFEPIPTTDK